MCRSINNEVIKYIGILTMVLSFAALINCKNKIQSPSVYNNSIKGKVYAVITPRDTSANIVDNIDSIYVVPNIKIKLSYGFHDNRYNTETSGDGTFEFVNIEPCVKGIIWAYLDTNIDLKGQIFSVGENEDVIMEDLYISDLYGNGGTITDLYVWPNPTDSISGALHYKTRVNGNFKIDLYKSNSTKIIQLKNGELDSTISYNATFWTIKEEYTAGIYFITVFHEDRFDAFCTFVKK